MKRRETMPESLTDTELFQSYSAWFFDFVNAHEGLFRILVMYSYNLFATLLIEVPLAILLGVRNRKDIRLVFIVNCVTNPIVVTCYLLISECRIFGNLTPLFLNGIILFLEILVVLSEGEAYRRFFTETKRNPFLLSFILNACSYGTGVILDLLGL